MYNSVKEYIAANWDAVIRVNREDKGQLIGLPYPYTVPAVGWFENLYYWDTYFTNVGLIIDGRAELAKNNTDDMLYLVNRFGYMPNSNGTFHLGQSQPPFLSIMVREVYEFYKDKVWLIGAYETLKREYEFWMTRRMTETGLNRYYSDHTDEEVAPRAKHYEDRVKMPVDVDRTFLGRHYMATCESGHDCTSKYDFEIQNFNPVCLNSLLYALETNMAYFSDELGRGEGDMWLERAASRKALMLKYMLDERGLLLDYNYVKGKHSRDFSAGSVLPLFCGLADEKIAADFVKNLDKLEAEYGLLANEKNDFPGNYQWGYPNGWACDQMMVVAALHKYGYKEEAKRFARKYINLADKVFAETQNLWEKYNVLEGSIDVASETEDGKTMPAMMGWSAGVYLYCEQYLNNN